MIFGNCLFWIIRERIVEPSREETVDGLDISHERYWFSVSNYESLLAAQKKIFHSARRCHNSDKFDARAPATYPVKLNRVNFQLVISRWTRPEIASGLFNTFRAVLISPSSFDIVRGFSSSLFERLYHLIKFTSKAFNGVSVVLKTVYRHGSTRRVRIINVIRCLWIYPTLHCHIETERMR